MNLIIIFGPAAVGKMTVGQALAKQTGLKLFHNHASIELVYQFFEFGTPAFRRLKELIRFAIFEEVAKSDLPGLIFTYTWALDYVPEDEHDESEDEYIDRIEAIFREVGAEIYYVELEADLNIRLQRNNTPNRLANKASKRDLERSKEVLLNEEETYRFNTLPGEFKRPNHLKIDNTHLEPEEVAKKVVEHFGLDH